VSLCYRQPSATRACASDVPRLVQQFIRQVALKSLALSLTTIFGLAALSGSLITQVPESESIDRPRQLLGPIINHSEDGAAAAMGKLIRHEFERPAIVEPPSAPSSAPWSDARLRPRRRTTRFLPR
jgi:hypothetical protein